MPKKPPNPRSESAKLSDRRLEEFRQAIDKRLKKKKGHHNLQSSMEVNASTSTGTVPESGAAKMAEADDTYQNVNVASKKLPPPVPEVDATEDWNILKNYLNMSPSEVKKIADDQEALINPSNRQMVRAAVVGAVGKSNFEFTSKLIRLMSYEGFNPVVVASEMSKRADDWNKTDRKETWELTLDAELYSVTEQAHVGKDVLFLATLFLTRGNNLRKILATIDKNVKTPLLVKIQTYKIKSDNDEESAKRKRSEKVDMQAKELTLSRITASFPQIALAIVKKTGVRGKVDFNCLKMAYKIKHKTNDEVPAILTHGLIPALLPKGDDSQTMELKRFCYYFNIEQSITLQMPSMKKTIINEPSLRIMESAEKFVNAAINGPLNCDQTRITLLKHLELYEPTEDLKKWISLGSSLYSRIATAGSYYMLQTQLGMELMSLTQAEH